MISPNHCSSFYLSKKTYIYFASERIFEKKNIKTNTLIISNKKKRRDEH